MAQPEYACTVCGRPFTRRWTTIRHINKIHDGSGEVETMMGYIVGVKLGNYPYPSYARPRTFPPWKKKDKPKAKDYADSFLHRSAEMARDSAAIVNHFREYRMQLSNPSFFGTMVNPFATADRVVGRVCKKCHFYDAIIVDKDGVKTSTKHECDQMVLANIQSLNEEAKASHLKQIYYNFLPAHIKSVVDSWIGAQKYISAVALDPSRTIKSTTVKLDSADESHYVLRAVKASRQGQSPVLITDAELMDLIRKRMATYAIFEVNGAAYQGRYLVKILPPPQQSQDEVSKIMKLLDKYIQRDWKTMQEELQKEEQELEAEEAESNKQDTMMQEEVRNVAASDVVMPSRPGSDSTSQQQSVQLPVHSKPPEEPSREAQGNSSINQDQPTTPAFQPTYFLHKNNLPDGSMRLILRLKIERSSSVLKSWIFGEMPTRKGKIAATQIQDCSIQAPNQASEVISQAGNTHIGSTLPIDDSGVCGVILYQPEKIVVELMGDKLNGVYCLSRDEPDSNRWKFYETSVLELNPADLQDIQGNQADISQ